MMMMTHPLSFRFPCPVSCFRLQFGALVVIKRRLFLWCLQERAKRGTFDN